MTSVAGICSRSCCALCEKPQTSSPVILLLWLPVSCCSATESPPSLSVQPTRRILTPMPVLVQWSSIPKTCQRLTLLPDATSGLKGMFSHWSATGRDGTGAVFYFHLLL